MSGRRAAFALIAALGGAAIGLAGAELWARKTHPSLPVQRVGGQHPLDLLGQGDDVFWRSRSVNDRRSDGCPAGSTGPRVLVQGSSILYGSNVADADATGPRLREALAARGQPEACVRVHAEPASTFTAQLAELRDDDGAPADLLIWELWRNSPHRFVRLGSVAYNFGQLELGADGVPDPFGLGALARPLLQHSRLYAWVALNRTPRRIHGDSNRVVWERFAPTFVAGARAQAERRGARLIVASFPPLDRPFAEQLDSNRRLYGPVIDALRAEGVTVLEMDRALREYDPADVRIDTCCHYNASGLQTVSGILADAALPLLTPPEPAGEAAE